jgi:DNA-binding CsgD family transcriptional regulator
MNPNRETIRLAATALTDQQFTCWSLSQAGYSHHRIAITTGLTRRTIRDHLHAADQALHRALENGETHQWPDTHAGNATPTESATTKTSPGPSAPSSNPQPTQAPPEETHANSEESPPSAPTSPAPSQAPPPTSLTATSERATLAPRHRARERPSSHPGTHAPGGKQHPDPPATPIRAHYAQKPAPPGALPHEQTDSGGQVTPYGDRRRAGEYDPDGTAGPTESTVHDPASGGTTVQVDADEVTLAELKEQAESLGLPTYGTKAQLAERIANA